MLKNAFIEFLKENFPVNYLELLQKFQDYYCWLLQMNDKINLISRQTNPDDIWTLHFLDSLLSVKFVDFSGKSILDFGTGGGLPGIPLAITYPDSSLTLLDSRKKKILALKDATQALEIQNCTFLDLRIEEVPAHYTHSFDIIVSRSVRMLPEFKKPLMNLLKEDGKLVLYKSQLLDDVELFKNPVIFDASSELIGVRKIVVINKNEQQIN